MVKACKAFGVNAIGFEHELLRMIHRMDQKRQDQRLNKGFIRRRLKDIYY